MDGKKAGKRTRRRNPGNDTNVAPRYRRKAEKQMAKMPAKDRPDGMGGVTREGKSWSTGPRTNEDLSKIYNKLASQYKSRSSQGQSRKNYEAYKEKRQRSGFSKGSGRGKGIGVARGFDSSKPK